MAEACDGPSVPVVMNNAMHHAPNSNNKIEEGTSNDEGDNIDQQEDSLSSVSPSTASPPQWPRLVAMYTTADWWSLWIGLSSFGAACGLVFLVPYERENTVRVRYVVPQPMKWKTDPTEAWDVYGIVGSIVLLLVLGGMYLTSLQFLGKLQGGRAVTISYVHGFAVMGVVATLSLWCGNNEWCSKNGFGYAIFAILFGMAGANSPLMSDGRLGWLKLAAKDGEFFIKCSLVLLAVEFSVLGEVGLPAIVVAWIGSPLALLAGYNIARSHWWASLIHPTTAGETNEEEAPPPPRTDPALALLVVCGATWCGASAVSAIGSVVGASAADMSLSVSVVVAFTVLFTFAQPYFARGVGMDDRVAGAWIGGSVDQTGNVVVSAAMLSEEATEVAGVVKIVLNAGLGVLATAVSLWWQWRDDHDNNNNNGDRERKKKVDWSVVWDKFPKFVLGYLICSVVLTLLLPRIEGTAEGDALQIAVKSLNKWWFSIAFVGIGIGTNFRELWKGAVSSGVIQLYLITNAIDIVLALGLAYLVF